MKHLLTLILTFTLTISCSIAFAYRPSATAEQVESFFNTTTYIIKKDDLTGEYNTFIKKAVEENWNITQYKFIEPSEFEALRMDAKNSFILMSEMDFGTVDAPAVYDYVSIILGGSYEDVSLMPELCSFPIDFTENSGTNMEHIPTIISFMNNHIKELKNNPKILKDKNYKFYTNKKAGIANKTLYLLEEQQTANFNTAEKIAKVYKGKVEFVEEDFITEAIAKKDASVLFLHRVSSKESYPATNCYTIIFGADGTLYYWNSHEIIDESNNGILEIEWKTFNKFVN